MNNKKPLAEKYKLTGYQKELLKDELIKGKTNTKEYLERIIESHIKIMKGIYKNKKDTITEKELYEKQVRYILNSDTRIQYGSLNKYNIANYYYHVAKSFDQIAVDKNVTRNKLWENIMSNRVIEKLNKTEKRIYKYIFRGEMIPSVEFVKRQLDIYDKLPCYMSIIYLNKEIMKIFKDAYEKLVEDIN